MKTKLRPSERSKKRYLLVSGVSKEELEKAILDYLGILGWARAEPFFVQSEGKRVILAVDRKEIDNVKAAFSLYPADIRVLRVSGTLKGLKK